MSLEAIDEMHVPTGTAKDDPRMKLDSTRLAVPPDHAREALALKAEIL